MVFLHERQLGVRLTVPIEGSLTKVSVSRAWLFRGTATDKTSLTVILNQSGNYGISEPLSWLARSPLRARSHLHKQEPAQEPPFPKAVER
jgi:hypothetical protein